MKFNFLKKYIIKIEDKSNTLKHNLYTVKKEDVLFVKNIINIPYELSLFYNDIGYGFFYQNSNSTNRLLSPKQFKQINLREDFYEFDPDLDLYDSPDYQDKFIFFEVNEGIYLLIEKNDINKKNAIYYFDEKIADSLEEFLLRFDKEGHYFEK